MEGEGLYKVVELHVNVNVNVNVKGVPDVPFTCMTPSTSKGTRALCPYLWSPWTP